MISSRPVYLPKTPSPDAITVELGIQGEFGGTQFSP